MKCIVRETLNDSYSSCDLFLVNVGEDKNMCDIIRLMIRSLNLTLRDAKMIYRNAPCYLKEFMPIDDALELKKEFEKLGTIIDIRYHK